MSSISRLESIYKDLEKEHRRVMKLMDRLRAQATVTDLLPLLDELRQEIPAADFQIIAVNVDANPKDGRAFLRKRPVGYPSASDPKGNLPSRFEVETMPTSFLIDRQGVIRYVHKGFRKGDMDELRERIKELVASGR